MWSNIPEVFPFFKRGRSQSQENLDTPASGSPKRSSFSRQPSKPYPTVRVNLDKVAYRPGDVVLATIDVSNIVRTSCKGGIVLPTRSVADSILIEDLSVEVKGIEKVDPQWLVTAKVPPGSKQRRGERTILESLVTSIATDGLLANGLTKTYLVRTMLPKVLPPSYRGTAVRYIFYLTVSLRWTPTLVENGHGGQSQLTKAPVEVRTPIQVWTIASNSGLTAEELHSADHYGFSGIVPPTCIKLELHWREKNHYSRWVQAPDIPNGVVDDNKSTKLFDNFRTTSAKGSLENSFSHSLYVNSPSGTPKGNSKDNIFLGAELGDYRSLKATMNSTSTSQSIFEKSQYMSDNFLIRSMDKKAGLWESSSGSSVSFDAVLKWKDGSVAGHENGTGGGREEDRGPLTSPPASPFVSQARSRTYNIKINDQVLVRFAPRNPQSTYYFGDTVSGTLSFSHEEGARRCLEVSAVLETREILNPSYLHPSRKNSSVISKIQSEYSETVCDMLNSHFIFSIPLDGPASFSTPLISVQWMLRFEFVASPPVVDWSKYAHPLVSHPLLIEERERGEWSLPIVVHAPSPPRGRKDRPLSPKRESLPRRDLTSYAFSPRNGSPGRKEDEASSSSSF